MNDIEMAHIAEYIARCADGNNGKVVEVGVGHRLEVVRLLIRMGIEVVATDVHPSSHEVFMDDVCAPNVRLYEGASVVYSLRPPPELWMPIARTAAGVGAQLIIRPFGSERVDLSAIYAKGRTVSAKGMRLMHFTEPKPIYRAGVCPNA